jgi:hypothetical protein
MLYLRNATEMLTDLRPWKINLDHQYNETNLMNFLFNLLRINSLYVFRALLVHPQGALNKRHLVYCMRVMSCACYISWLYQG